MRRRDVVAIRCKDDERIVNASQVDHAIGADAQLALLKTIADEEILDDRQHLLATEEVEAVPPTLEFEKPLPLLVQVREQIGVFLPDPFRLQVLEILHQPGAIKPAIAEIGSQA